MAKTKRDTTQLKGVTIKARAGYTGSRGKSVVQGKEVDTKRIDSARRANPSLNRALGKPGKNSGGMDEYRNEKADLVNKALAPKRKSK